MAQYLITEIEDYESLVGTETIQRIRQKAANWKGLRAANFNSMCYGGGVAEAISSLTLLMNSPRTTRRVVSDPTHTRFFSRS
jgi:trehalose synthase